MSASAARRRLFFFVVEFRLRRRVPLRYEPFEMRINLVFGPGDAPSAEFERSRELAGLNSPLTKSSHPAKDTSYGMNNEG